AARPGPRGSRARLAEELRVVLAPGLEHRVEAHLLDEALAGRGELEAEEVAGGAAGWPVGELEERPGDRVAAGADRGLVERVDRRALVPGDAQDLHARAPAEVARGHVPDPARIVGDRL